MVLACSHLRLKSEQSKRHMMPILMSMPLNASVSMTENMRFKSIRARTQLCLTPLETENEFCGASVLHHDSPKALSTDNVKSVKNLGQINVGGVQVVILFLTLILQLSCDEHHVHYNAIVLEAALTLRQETVLKMFDEWVQENPSQPQ